MMRFSVMMTISQDHVCCIVFASSLRVGRSEKLTSKPKDTMTLKMAVAMSLRMQEVSLDIY